MDTHPQSSPELPPPPRAQGCGCCAAGCGTLLVIGLLALALMIGATWYGYHKVVNTLTAAGPRTVQLQQPTAEEYAAADAKLNQLWNAAAAKQAVTVEFTGPELNALIARHPRFARVRDRMSAEIAGSVATLDLSVPLSGVSWPGINRRWFNGSASFGLSYDENGFSFSPRSIEANGYNFGEELFGDLAPTINNYFDREYAEPTATENQNDTETERFWQQVRSLKVIDDKVVVTTKGGAS